MLRHSSLCRNSRAETPVPKLPCRNCQKLSETVRNCKPLSRAETVRNCQKPLSRAETVRNLSPVPKLLSETNARMLRGSE